MTICQLIVAYYELNRKNGHRQMEEALAFLLLFQTNADAVRVSDLIFLHWQTQIAPLSWQETTI